MARLVDFRAESLQETGDVSSQEQEGTYDSMLFDGAELVERYIRGELSLHVHYFITVQGLAQEGVFCARIAAIKDGVLGRFRPERKSNLRTDGHDVEREGTMFVRVVKRLEDGQREVVPVRTVVRLNFLDDCPNRPGGIDRLYLSLITGDLVTLNGPVAEDRELRLDRWRPTGASDEDADGVIKRGTKLIDHLSRDNAESARDYARLVKASERFALIRLVIDDSRIRCFVDEPIDFGVELVDVLVGPA